MTLHVLGEGLTAVMDLSGIQRLMSERRSPQEPCVLQIGFAFLVVIGFQGVLITVTNNLVVILFNVSPTLIGNEEYGSKIYRSGFFGIEGGMHYHNVAGLGGTTRAYVGLQVISRVSTLSYLTQEGVANPSNRQTTH